MKQIENVGINVFDDLLDDAYFNYLQKCIEEYPFQWIYSPDTTYENTLEYGSFGFSHLLLNLRKSPLSHQNFESRYYPHFAGLICAMEKYTGNYNIPIRSRVDMLLYNPDIYQHGPHIDCDWESDYVTTIFYMNESDGETLIFDKFYDGTHKSLSKEINLPVKKRIEPKENRLVVFDGALYHTGHSPSTHKNRIVVNSNFIAPHEDFTSIS